MNEIRLNVSGIAHDLNNQLMILMNALDRVMILYPNHADAGTAMRAAEHCALLTSQLIPKTQVQSAPAVCSIKEVVSEAAILLRPQLPACNRIEVACHTDSLIAAPALAIQQAIIELGINARDAMDGPGVISIEAEHVGQSVVLSIRDTGPGIPAEMRESVFEPVFTTKSARGGFGLGLDRVRETVEQSGGTISIHDAFPKGALFRIVLPTV